MDTSLVNCSNLISYIKLNQYDSELHVFLIEGTNCNINFFQTLQEYSFDCDRPTLFIEALA
jgi:hypothetical protein